MSNLIISGLDRPVPFNSDDLSFEIDGIMERAIAEKNVEIALNAGLSLRKATELGNFGIAKLAYELKVAWDQFEIGSPFEDVIFEWWGLHKTTQERYIRIWEMRLSGDVPPELLPELEQRPLDDQIKIATAWASGEDISQTDWKDLAEAENPAKVNEILRRIKDVEPRKNALFIRLTRNGDLYAYPGQDKSGVYIGYLDLDGDNDVVRKAVTRIINNSHILQD